MSRLRRRWGFGAAIACIVLVGLLIRNNGSRSPDETPVSADAFARVTAGSDYEEVRRILGSPGSLIEVKGMGASEVKIYEWPTQGGRPRRIIFESGKARAMSGR